MIHIPFEQQVKKALTELQKEYPFIYPEYEDVEHYLRQLKNPENLSLDGLLEFLLNSPNTEIDDENQTILSRIKTLDQNDYPIHLYLDFPINASQANYFIKNIRDKAEQEKYREIQEEIEILLTKASISSEKQLDILANIISNLNKPILHYEAKDNNVIVRR